MLEPLKFCSKNWPPDWHSYNFVTFSAVRKPKCMRNGHPRIVFWETYVFLKFLDSTNLAMELNLFPIGNKYPYHECMGKYTINGCYGLQSTIGGFSIAIYFDQESNL